MSQAFTDDCYDSSHIAATDLQNMENNFAALKTNFSGSSAPSSPSALQWWADTNNNILKLRNEANTAWLDIYDFANQVLLADIDVGVITAAMIDDAARKPSLVASQAITPSSVTTTTATITTLIVSGYSMVPNATAGTYMEGSDDYLSYSIPLTATKHVEMYIPRTGTYTIRIAGQFDWVSGRTFYLRIYKNGATHGTQRSITSTSLTTFDEDLAFTRGDLVQLYTWCSNSGHTGNAYLKVGSNNPIIPVPDNWE